MEWISAWWYSNITETELHVVPFVTTLQYRINLWNYINSLTYTKHLTLLFHISYDEWKLNQHYNVGLKWICSHRNRSKTIYRFLSRLSLEQYAVVDSPWPFNIAGICQLHPLGELLWSQYDVVLYRWTLAAVFTDTESQESGFTGDTPC